MKILIVNTFDFGGAANSCKRLHLAFLKEGIDSKVLLKHKNNNWPNSFQFEKIKKPLTILQRVNQKLRRIGHILNIYRPKLKSDPKSEFLKQRSKGLEMFSFPQSSLDITASQLYEEADIINLHWVANFLDLETFFLKNNKPVVWTLHDMNPFTGGEHYKEEYLGIDEDGKPLKRSYSNLELEIISENIALKRKIFSKIDKLYFVAPSQWIAKEAKKNDLLQNAKIIHIPNGLDPEIFRLHDSIFSRNFFKIPANKKVILFVAESLENQRKGLEFLNRALEELKRDDIVLCAVGRTSSHLNFDNFVPLGSLNDERLMSLAYSAADVFVIPSIIDNLPNTVLESLMCGTPVIGFPAGGIPEMIIHGKNGLLAKEISVEALKQSIIEFLDHPEVFDRKDIRENAIRKYDENIQADNYRKLFGQLIEKRNKFN